MYVYACVRSSDFVCVHVCEQFVLLRIRAIRCVIYETSCILKSNCMVDSQRCTLCTVGAARAGVCGARASKPASAFGAEGWSQWWSSPTICLHYVP